jgi:hypothetical protein
MEAPKTKRTKQTLIGSFVARVTVKPARSPTSPGAQSNREIDVVEAAYAKIRIPLRALSSSKSSIFL